MAETTQLVTPDLREALKQALLTDEGDWDESALHATDTAVALDTADGGKCARQLWLRLQGAEQRKQKPGEVLMQDHGHRIHERVTQLLVDPLRAQGWTIAFTERSAAHGLPGDVVGTPDAVMSGPDGEYVVVDYKSVRGNWFRYNDGPREAWQLQVQTYCRALDADCGKIMTLDREGQNWVREYTVPRDDKRVADAITAAQMVAAGSEPPVLAPQLKRNRNQGPDSVEVKQPWQCDYCPFLDVSCPGALPKEQREQGIVGHVDDTGAFTPKPGHEDMSETVEALLDG